VSWSIYISKKPYELISRMKILGISTILIFDNSGRLEERHLGIRGRREPYIAPTVGIDTVNELRREAKGFNRVGGRWCRLRYLHERARGLLVLPSG